MRVQHAGPGAARHQLEERGILCAVVTPTPPALCVRPRARTVRRTGGVRQGIIADISLKPRLKLQYNSHSPHHKRAQRLCRTFEASEDVEEVRSSCRRASEVGLPCGDGTNGSASDEVHELESVHHVCAYDLDEYALGCARQLEARHRSGCPWALPPEQHRPAPAGRLGWVSCASPIL